MSKVPHFDYKVPGVKISPPRLRVLDTSTKKYRGGQVWSVGASVVVRLYLEPNLVGERTIASALAPSVVVGDPVCCEVTGTSPDYTVVAVHPTGFLDQPGISQALSVERGDFHAGFVPASLGGND